MCIIIKQVHTQIISQTLSVYNKVHMANHFARNVNYMSNRKCTNCRADFNSVNYECPPSLHSKVHDKWPLTTVILCYYVIRVNQTSRFLEVVSLPRFDAEESQSSLLRRLPERTGPGLTRPCCCHCACWSLPWEAGLPGPSPVPPLDKPSHTLPVFWCPPGVLERSYQILYPITEHSHIHNLKW